MLRDNADAWVTCGIVVEPRLALGFLNCLSQQAPVSWQQYSFVCETFLELGFVYLCSCKGASFGKWMCQSWVYFTSSFLVVFTKNRSKFSEKN